MQIDVNSWHYKFLGKVVGELNIPDNLCNYFWLLVWRIIIFISNGIGMGVMGLIGLLVGSAMLTVPITIILNLFGVDTWALIYTNAEELTKITLFGVFLVFGSFLWVCIIVCVLSEFLPSWFNSLRTRKVGDAATSNLLTEFISAKKNKYCPRIKFFDSKEVVDES